MGNPLKDGKAADNAPAIIEHYYSKTSWIEGTAVDQLHHIAGLSGVRSVKAFPDLHPGKYGPVGCAIQSDRLYPHLIGNDIGCGMSLFALDIPVRKLRLDKVSQKFRTLEGSWDGDRTSRLQIEDLPADLHPESLGTIGGGNHFCELQAIDSIFDPELLKDLNISKDQTLLLVHSGSRSFGVEVFGTIQDLMNGIDTDSPRAQTYMQQHDQAVRWARLNRQIIAERASSALKAKCTLITDSPHNLVTRYEDGFLHRKGAAKANMPFVPLAGSRDSLSYLLKPTQKCRDSALSSLAHGSGRKYDRSSMAGRVGTTKSSRAQLTRTSFGGQVICEDRQLLVEEAPSAYKDSAQVLNDLISTDLVICAASLKPLVTFKKATLEQKKDQHQQRRRYR